MKKKFSSVIKPTFGNKQAGYFVFLVLVILTWGAAGCSREANKEVDYQAYVSAGQEYVMLQNLTNENLKWVYRILQSPGMEDGVDTIRKVIIRRNDLGGDSAMYILDYSKFWYDYDSVHKDGEISVLVKGKMDQPGDIATVVLDEFSIGGNQINGQVIFEHLEDKQEMEAINIRTQDINYQDTTGKVHAITLNQRAYVEKFIGTPGENTMRFFMSGSAGGTTINQKHYDALIADTSALLDSLQRTRVQSGSVVLDIEGGNAGLTFINFFVPNDTANQYRLYIDNEKYELVQNQ